VAVRTLSVSDRSLYLMRSAILNDNRFNGDNETAITSCSL